jgi:DNA-binding GntR family transcriptional regulator
VHTVLHTGGLHTGGLHTGLRSELAYAELKQRLLHGDFRLGARLKEIRLAAALGVSRTPVREALLRLHAEGLVQRQADGGYVPVVPDVAAVRWLYEVRAGLELQALRRVPHDVEILGAVLDEWEAFARDEPEPDTSFVLLDESFHLGLAESAGNPALVDLLRQVNERIRVVRMVDFLTPDRITSTVAEHVDIVKAVLAGDHVAATEAFLGHLDHSQAVVEQRVAAAIARMAGAPDMEEDA